MIEAYFMCGTCLLLAGVIIDIVSVASDEWEMLSGVQHTGLWRICLGDDSCLTVESSDSLRAVEAMIILSVIAAGISLVIAVVEIAYSAVKYWTSHFVKRFVAACTFFAFAFNLVGIVVYHTRIMKPRQDANINTTYGYSFWLGVASTILFFLAGILFVASAIRFIGIRRKRQEQLFRQNYIRSPYSEPTPKRMKEEAHSIKAYNEPIYPRPLTVHPAPRDYYYMLASPTPFPIYSYGDRGVINPLYRLTPGYALSVQAPVHEGYGLARGRQNLNRYTRSQNGRDTRNHNDSFYSSWETSTGRTKRDPYGYPLNYQRD